ncbi:hypothetical protein [Cryobacterium sp. PH29-G1]|uniref:hypothetical protein n=1 Tax=Cryobacterium sp. PH29-G1 TaxID=3046211 RepID=UPI0024BBD809|nr:hypothetical protein [Cryobacterium sp. PH29-G1]MDJ0349679.1 hypothetical protein [Cryobacterium sp. PH29-G1]
MEFTPNPGTGMSDAMHAARTETRRIMAENKGDLVAEQKAVLARLTTAKLITDTEAKTLLALYKIGFDAGEPKGNPQRAYFESREVYSKLAVSGTASPVALVIASAAVGSFELVDDPKGPPTVVAFKRSYGQSGAAIGAGIGAILGGPAGAILGGEIGGLIGGIVDDKKDKK